MTNVSPSFTDPQDAFTVYERTNLIANRRVTTAAGLDVLNPATAGVLGQTAFSSAEETAEAVETARAAQVAWAKVPARDRGKRVAAAARAMAENVEIISQVLALETGKAIRTECRGETATAADIMEFYGGLGSELKGETVPYNPRMLTMTTREPLGVVAAIVPWNVPLVLMALKIAPALVAGNTVVVKAAEEAPFATLLAAEILMQHLPAGVLNVIVGDGPTCGNALTHDPKISKISFTGSEAVGEHIYKVGAERIIPVSLELGGKSPMIICADADMDKTVPGAIAGMRFTRQGQSCTASSRIYVHESVYDVFVERLCADLDKLVIGDPMDEATDVGTIISTRQAAVVRGFVEQAEATDGVDVRRLGTLALADHLSPELFLQPTLLLNVPEDHPTVMQEIFGPVTVIAKWSDYDDVIDQANATHYGLAASIWTRDLSTALDATARLDAGFVQVNQGLTIQPNVSYGGFGRSGLGKEASLEAMLEHFTRKKTIVINFD